MLQHYICVSTPQRVFVLAAKHCPSQGRTGDPCWVSQAAQETRRYRCPPCGGFVPQSVLVQLDAINPGEYSHMLVYQQYANVFPLRRKPFKGLFNVRRFSLAVDDEEVLLCIWWCRDMLLDISAYSPYLNSDTDTNAGKEQSSDRVLGPR